MAEFLFRPATGDNRKPLIGFYGKSGSGKTHSALLLARGYAGPQGKVLLIDTENKRGSFFFDLIPGGYDVTDLGEPFSSARYIEAMDAAFKGKADIVIVDSMSHEWEGIGGVLDWAAKIEDRTGKPGLHCWADPKEQHGRMLLKLLNAPCPVICCLRAKYKTRQVTTETGQKVIVKDDFLTPIQDGDFIYEMTCHVELGMDHKMHVTKLGHPGLKMVFPEGFVVTEEYGRALRAWTTTQPAAPPSPWQIILTNGNVKTYAGRFEWLHAITTMAARMPDAAAVDAWLERNKAPLAIIHYADVEAAMDAVTITENRKLELAGGQQ